MAVDHPDARFPLVDLELARRLERTEAEANAAFVEARAQLEPQIGATWMEVAGAYAMFDGITSPLTQTFGLGLFEPVADEVFERLESFFADRGAPVLHEISPLVDSALLSRLNHRGYQPIEFSSVLIRPTRLAARPRSSLIRVRLVDATDADLWSHVAAEGWSSESPELASFVERFGQIVARSRGTSCFLAELDGRPIAAAALHLSEELALLAGASTIPMGRRQGAQLALLEARLQFAAERGVELAMMVAQPGSASQRNAERQGFRIAYTRLKWQLRKSDRDGAPPVARAVEFENATPILRVSDFDVSVAYYVDALGFSLAWRDGRFGCVRRGDATLMLCEGSQGCTSTWVYLAISDADALQDEIRSRGARIRHPPTNYPWGSRELHVFDPDGHVLRLGSDARPGESLGAWLDEAGVRWLPQPDGSWARVE